MINIFVLILVFNINGQEVTRVGKQSFTNFNDCKTMGLKLLELSKKQEKSALKKVACVPTGLRVRERRI